MFIELLNISSQAHPLKKYCTTKCTTKFLVLSNEKNLPMDGWSLTSYVDQAPTIFETHQGSMLWYFLDSQEQLAYYQHIIPYDELDLRSSFYTTDRHNLMIGKCILLMTAKFYYLHQFYFIQLKVC